jgi:hypothetical protein
LIRAVCSSLFVFATLCTCVKPGQSTTPNGVNHLNGINWADERDNFVDHFIVPSGLDSTDTFAACYTKAHFYIRQFSQLMGVNSLRLGVNAPTILDGDYYARWQAILAAAKKENMNIILACWERPTEKDGKTDSRFFDMWDVLVRDYGGEGSVYFEPMNEPYGYTANQWTSVALSWLQRYSHLPRNRLLVAGWGYSEQVKELAKDKRFDGCLFSVHLYAWFSQANTEKAWYNEIEAKVGKANAYRTVLTEFGVPMKTGINYLSGSSEKNSVFFRAITTVAHDWQLGSIYWPGLRDNDDYSILERRPDDSLRVTNETGLQLIRKSFRQ